MSGQHTILYTRKKNPHHIASAKVHAHFGQENDPTKPYAMHKCVGMDWYYERNEGVHICTVLASCNFSMLNFNNNLESVY